MNRLLDIYDTQETMSSNIDSIIEAAKMIEAADKTDLIKEKKIKWVKRHLKNGWKKMEKINFTSL